jgi:carbamoyl-phosphate synthase large subunit
LPDSGLLFISVNDRDKPTAVQVAAKFAEFGFKLAATRGTAAALQAAGLAVKTVFKVNEGRPNAVDLLKAGSMNLVIYTTTGGHSFSDEQAIRRAAVSYRIPCITTISGAKAAAEAIASSRRDPIRVWSLQEIHRPAAATSS